MSHTQRLHETLAALGPIQNLAVENGGVSFSSNGATKEQEAAMRAVVDRFDWSDEACIKWQTINDRTKAIAALFGDAGHIPVGLRATFRVLWTALNDVRQSVGQKRLTEKEIAGMIITAIQAGEGDPVTNKSAVK